jgi:hypothetical protein
MTTGSVASFATALLWVACVFLQPAAADAVEEIGTVTQVYDGTLTSDIQVRTFRNIDAALTASVQRPRFFPRRAAGFVAAGFVVTAAMLKDFRAHTMHSSASSRASAGTS